MKNIFFLLFLPFVFIGCNPNDDNTPPGNTNLNSTEQQLVGQWKLKRTEGWSSGTFPGLGDSITRYINHYNYTNSQLDLSDSPSGYENQYIAPYSGGDDDSGPYLNERWYFDENLNYLYLGGDPYIIKYLSSDSLVIMNVDNNGRAYYNKNTITPSINSIEAQLIGTWRLTSVDGTVYPYPSYQEFYYKFYSNWYSDKGYYKVDSLVNYTWPLQLNPFVVLYPERQIPILATKMGGSMFSSYYYYKIISLDSNTLILESFLNPTINSESESNFHFEKQ